MLRLIIQSILLGIGLAMDAFSVSVVGGLTQPDMPYRRMCGIAGCFGAFQTGMPLIGWAFVHVIEEHIAAFSAAVPWIALVILAVLGARMILESRRGAAAAEDGAAMAGSLSGIPLIMQGIATSIDALSVGLTLADSGAGAALLSAVIIGSVTFVICMGGLRIGRRFGERLRERAGYVGGTILILIGLEIWLRAML